MSAVQNPYTAAKESEWFEFGARLAANITIGAHAYSST